MKAHAGSQNQMLVICTLAFVKVIKVSAPSGKETAVIQVTGARGGSKNES
jgi:hypothetical protein